MGKKKTFTSGNFTYRLNKNKEAVVTGALQWSEVITIPEQLDGHTVVAIGNGAFDTDKIFEENRLAPNPVTTDKIGAKHMDLFINDHLIHIIHEVRLPETIRVIEPCAFYYNYNLEKINFPKGLQEIGALAFANASLGNITVPRDCKICNEKGDEIWQEQGAFEGCGGYDKGGWISPECSIEVSYYD